MTARLPVRNGWTDPLFAFVVISRRAFFLAKACVNKDHVRASIGIVADDRLPDLPSARSHPEHICFEVSLETAGIDGSYPGFRNTHIPAFHVAGLLCIQNAVFAL